MMTISVDSRVADHAAGPDSIDTESAPPTLVLASGSARRVELLQQLGLQPICMPVDVDESAVQGESAIELVSRLAKKKALACAASAQFNKLIENHRHHVILGADTVVDLDGQILGKPRDQAHVVELLQSLSARCHLVHTGVFVQSANGDSFQQIVVSTQVRFAPLSLETVLSYWRSGEPEGKAGGYAIQGKGAQFVEHLSGSYSNVVGLPLFETSQLLAKVGLSRW